MLKRRSEARRQEGMLLLDILFKQLNVSKKSMKFWTRYVWGAYPKWNMPMALISRKRGRNHLQTPSMNLGVLRSISIRCRILRGMCSIWESIELAKWPSGNLKRVWWADLVRRRSCLLIREQCMREHYRCWLKKLIW